jgi:hypothetical protein
VSLIEQAFDPVWRDAQVVFAGRFVGLAIDSQRSAAAGFSGWAGSGLPVA